MSQLRIRRGIPGESSEPMIPIDHDEPDSWYEADGAVAISDVPHVRALLIAAARQAQPLTYAGLLNALGHPFTRPRMRALCRTLDAIDDAGRARGEPELAVLVVRQSDGLPGQGWWMGRTTYAGAWTGHEALAFVRGLQAAAFGFWRDGT